MEQIFGTYNYNNFQYEVRDNPLSICTNQNDIFWTFDIINPCILYHNTDVGVDWVLFKTCISFAEVLFNGWVWPIINALIISYKTYDIKNTKLNCFIIIFSVIFYYLIIYCNRVVIIKVIKYIIKNTIKFIKHIIKAIKNFEYEFWVGVLDRTPYEILLHLGFVVDPDYDPVKNKEIYDRTLLYSVFYVRWDLKRNIYLIYLDNLFFSITFFKFIISNNFLYRNNRGFVRRSQTSNNFLYGTNNKTSHNSYIRFFNFGWSSFFKSTKYWFFVILFMLLVVYYCLVIRLLPFNKIIFQWFMVLMFFYWLLSGFVFFIKKYQYRYFTSSIQRFWRRCFSIFWMLEAYLFLCFLYLTLNASQEPVFMYDNIQVYKTHLFSWKLFLLKLFPLTLLIILTYFLLLSLKWNTFSKTNYLCIFITTILFYIMWLEFYQFFHIVSYFGNLSWVYDIEDHLWNLESEWKRTRVSNHFVTICLIAKFWHLVFVFIFWIFFVVRGLEISRLRYPLLSANFQNFIIIYVMGWLYMYPWIKYIIKKFLEMPYFWFYINNRRLVVYIFFNDLKLFYYNIFNNLINISYVHRLFSYNMFHTYNFYYWHESSIFTGYTQYRKNFIRDIFIKNLM